MNPIACLVSNTKHTSPSSGALTIASSGVTTAPSPIIRPANASSGVVERSAASPVIGLEITIVSTTFFSPALSSIVASSDAF